MSTRQIRLSDPHQIKSSIKSFLQTNINIVLHNGNVVFGLLHAVSDTGIIIINKRLEKMKLPLQDINEIYSDKKV